MTAIGATHSATAPAVDPIADRRDPEASDSGSFQRLWERPSGLDLLLADAGPLGKFHADMPDRMPSGTGALTARISDALNRLAARLGLPAERILSGPVADPRHGDPLPAADLQSGPAPHPVHTLSPDALQPASETSTHVHVTPRDRGEPAA